MISADLESLRLAHYEPDFSRFLVLQKLHGPCASLFPLFPIFIETIQFCFSETKTPKTKKRKVKKKNPKIKDELETLEDEDESVQIENWFLFFLAGRDSDLFEPHNRSYLCACVFVFGRCGFCFFIFSVTLLWFTARHCYQLLISQREREFFLERAELRSGRA